MAGSDTNDGRSAQTPYKTLAKLTANALGAGVVVYLARGSLWREELTALPQASQIRPYGQGERPIIDGSDVAPNGSFKKSAGLSNVYEISWTHRFAVDSGKTAHRAWENGVRMRRAPDLATCDSTPGTFYAPTITDGGPDTIYVHAADNSSVITNAKTYELTRRRWALQLYTFRKHASVYSVHTRRNAHADGNLVVDGYISDCVAEDGRIHNVFVRGVAEDTLAWKIEPPDVLGSATMFVTYEDQMDLPGVVYRRCTAKAETDAFGPMGGQNQYLTLGFFAHTALGRSIGTAIYEQCAASGVTQGFNLQQVDNALYYKCAGEGFTIAVSAIPRQTLAVLGGTFRTQQLNASLVRYSDDYGVPNKIILRGVRYSSESPYVQPIWITRQGGTVEITRCTFAQYGGGLFNFQMGSFVVRNNIFSGNNFNMNKNPGVLSYSANQNIFYETNMVPVLMAIGTTNYNGLAAWQAASGQDLASLETDPMFTGVPKSGDFHTSTNSPATTLTAGAEFQGEEADTTLQAYRQMFVVP